VTTPAAETLAIAAFSLDQVTVLSSASSGVTVAWRVKVLPFLTVAVAPSAIATPVAGFGATEEETGASEAEVLGVLSSPQPARIKHAASGMRNKDLCFI
jgi:hypothetical protein